MKRWSEREEEEKKLIRLYFCSYYKIFGFCLETYTDLHYVYWWNYAENGWSYIVDLFRILDLGGGYESIVFVCFLIFQIFRCWLILTNKILTKCLLWGSASHSYYWCCVKVFPVRSYLSFDFFHIIKLFWKINTLHAMYYKNEEVRYKKRNSNKNCSSKTRERERDERKL